MVHTDELTARDRAAAILVIVFGQRIEDVIQLTWNDVTVTDDVVTVRLGKTEFALPSSQPTGTRIRGQPLHTRPVIRQGYHDRPGTQRHEILGRL